MRFILGGLLLVLLVGCNQSETGRKHAKRGMTAEQAEMILAMTVGQWKITHSENASGRDSGPRSLEVASKCINLLRSPSPPHSGQTYVEEGHCRYVRVH